ncbi:unnamed protein product, partial [Clonostachys byssicola]
MQRDYSVKNDGGGTLYSSVLRLGKGTPGPTHGELARIAVEAHKQWREKHGAHNVPGVTTAEYFNPKRGHARIMISTSEAGGKGVAKEQEMPAHYLQESKPEWKDRSNPEHFNGAKCGEFGVMGLHGKCYPHDMPHRSRMKPMVVTVGEKDQTQKNAGQRNPGEAKNIVIHAPCNGVKPGTQGAPDSGGCDTVMRKAGYRVVPDHTKIADSFNLGNFKKEKKRPLGDPNNSDPPVPKFSDEERAQRKQLGDARDAMTKARSNARKKAKEDANKQQLSSPGGASDGSGDEGFGNLFGRSLRKGGSSRLRRRGGISNAW